MSEIHPLAISGDYTLYPLPMPGRFAIVQTDVPVRTGPAALDWAPELTQMLRAVLGQRSLLYRAGTAPVFIINGRPIMCGCQENSWAELHRIVPCATFGAAAAPVPLEMPSRALDVDNVGDLWRMVCRANEFRPAKYSLSNSPRMIHALANTDEITPWGGILKHPVVGELPAGWFGVPAPQPPSGSRVPRTPVNAYELLRRLFDPLPLDAASHARLYSYLLACFHADSLTIPMPLLVVDSWCQGMGKTEACSAIAELVNGGRSSLSPPFGTNVDEVVAHFNSGHRLACFDNLQCERPWNNAWLCTLLTDRQAAARAKYQAGTTTFAGRLATLTMIFGDAFLHPDLISRSWRVQLWGSEAKPLAHRPNRFAEEHREALQAACYWTVKEAPLWPNDDPITDTRCGEAERIGLAAYCHLFGKDPMEVAATLKENERDVRALSSQMARFFRRADPELSVGSQTSPLSTTLRKEERLYVLGARALGYRATELKGKPHLTEETI